MSATVRRLAAGEAGLLRDLRLRALRDARAVVAWAAQRGARRLTTSATEGNVSGAALY